MTLPLTLAQPPLLEPPRRDTRPPAVAVLEDWLREHAERWKADDSRDWLETWQGGVQHGAPLALCEEAYIETQVAWEALTAPSKVFPLLASARGRGTVGKLRLETYEAGRMAHWEALQMALPETKARNVRTWVTGGHYGCASDEVRLWGTAVVVRRLHRVTEDSRQAVRWPSGTDVPDGWERDGDYIRRDCGHWRRA